MIKDVIDTRLHQGNTCIRSLTDKKTLFQNNQHSGNINFILNNQAGCAMRVYIEQSSTGDVVTHICQNTFVRINENHIEEFNPIANLTE